MQHVPHNVQVQLGLHGNDQISQTSCNIQQQQRGTECTSMVRHKGSNVATVKFNKEEITRPSRVEVQQ